MGLTDCPAESRRQLCRGVAMAVTVFYGLLFLLAVLNLMVFIVFRTRSNNFFYGLFLLLAAAANGGYLFVALSHSLGEAIMATKISYMGGCFLPSILLICVIEFCQLRIGWIGRLILVTGAFAEFVMVLTIGYSDVFYKDLSFSRADHLSRLGYATGSGYMVFVVVVYLYLLSILGVCIYAFREKTSVSYKNMVYLLAAALIAALAYFVLRYLYLQINFVPLAFALDGIIILSLQHRLAIYDVSATVAESILNQGNYGYIVLDRHKNFIASDEAARHFFPQVQPLHVDFSLPQDDPFFMKLTELMARLDDTLNGTVGYMENHGREYKIEVEYLTAANGHKNGYYVEMTDATEVRENERRILNYNEKLKSAVAEETKHLKDVQDQMLLGMANMIENRDNSTGGHIRRTSMGVKILVKELMARDEWDGIFTAKYCEAMIKAAPLHDVGKIAVDDDILKKPGRFTPGEFEQMKMHAPKGAELLHSVIAGIEDPYFVQIAENMAHYHHERWNGTGYPDKLQGDAIPMEARVMAIADVYDALVSKRCYKDAMTYEEAANIIMEGMGTQFDPSLEDVFVTCRPRLERYYDVQLKLSDEAC